MVEQPTEQTAETLIITEVQTLTTLAISQQNSNKFITKDKPLFWAYLLVFKENMAKIIMISWA